MIEFNEERHEYRWNGVVKPSVTQILAASGRCSWDCVDEETRKYALKRGQTVHWLCQLEDEGALNWRTVPTDLRGYRKSWRSWKRHSGFQVLWIERIFYVARYGFAGRVDRTGSFPATSMYGTGSSGVVDLKTGEIGDWVRFQLCLYTLAVDPRPAIARRIRRIGVGLRADGTYKVKEWPAATWDQDFAEVMNDLRSMQKHVGSYGARAGTQAGSSDSR